MIGRALGFRRANRAGQPSGPVGGGCRTQCVHAVRVHRRPGGGAPSSSMNPPHPSRDRLPISGMRRSRTGSPRTIRRWGSPTACELLRPRRSGAGVERSFRIAWPITIRNRRDGGGIPAADQVGGGFPAARAASGSGRPTTPRGGEREAARRVAAPGDAGGSRLVIANTGDGYGRNTTTARHSTGSGRGRLWPLLSGERGHYELCRGNDPRALPAHDGGHRDECGMFPGADLGCRGHSRAAPVPGQGHGLGDAPGCGRMPSFVQLAISQGRAIRRIGPWRLAAATVGDSKLGICLLVRARPHRERAARSPGCVFA